MESKQQISILCVDDEPSVLQGLTQLLRRRYAVHTATSGIEGLAIVKQEPRLAVIVSDMNMPGMTGAEFLAQARLVAPDAIRILLTGQSDFDDAVAAVNHGQIFRFLSKPCPPPLFLVAIDAAAEQHRLIIAERVLLEETLRGSVLTLTDVLAMTNPMAFGRATRIKQTALELASQLGLKDLWQLEVAATFSQLGLISLPAEVIEKLHYGQPLTEAEAAMVARAPALTEHLLARIPRLEDVREILLIASRPPERRNPLSRPLDARGENVHRAANVLRLATDLDGIEARAVTLPATLAALRAHADRYEPEVFNALLRLRDVAPAEEVVSGLPLSSLRVGMIVAEDVKLRGGALLVARGYEVTHSFVERARNFAPGAVSEPIKVHGRF